MWCALGILKCFFYAFNISIHSVIFVILVLVYILIVRV